MRRLAIMHCAHAYQCDDLPNSFCRFLVVLVHLHLNTREEMLSIPLLFLFRIEPVLVISPTQCRHRHSSHPRSFVSHVTDEFTYADMLGRCFKSVVLEDTNSSRLQFPLGDGLVTTAKLEHLVTTTTVEPLALLSLYSLYIAL